MLGGGSSNKKLLGDAAALGVRIEGLTDQPVEEEAFEVLPCNWESVTWMITLWTQWRVGFDGRVGLDNLAVIETLREFGIKRKRRAEILRDMMIMEVAILEKMAEARTSAT